MAYGQHRSKYLVDTTPLTTRHLAVHKLSSLESLQVETPILHVEIDWSHSFLGRTHGPFYVTVMCKQTNIGISLCFITVSISLSLSVCLSVCLSVGLCPFVRSWLILLTVLVSWCLAERNYRSFPGWVSCSVLLKGCWHGYFPRCTQVCLLPKLLCLLLTRLSSSACHHVHQYPQEVKLYSLLLKTAPYSCLAR